MRRVAMRSGRPAGESTSMNDTAISPGATQSQPNSVRHPSAGRRCPALARRASQRANGTRSGRHETSGTRDRRTGDCDVAAVSRTCPIGTRTIAEQAGETVKLLGKRALFALRRVRVVERAPGRDLDLRALLSRLPVTVRHGRLGARASAHVDVGSLRGGGLRLRGRVVQPRSAPCARRAVLPRVSPPHPSTRACALRRYRPRSADGRRRCEERFTLGLPRCRLSSKAEARRPRRRALSRPRLCSAAAVMQDAR